MSSDLVLWLANPVTLALALALAGLVFLMLEILAGGLGELGNVRFQGLLEDNPGLLSAGHDGQPPQLSRLLDAIRWVEILVLSVIWALAIGLAGETSAWNLWWGLAVPLLAAVLSQLTRRSVTEEGLALLLRTWRPLLVPILAVVVRGGAGEVAVAGEDEDEEASEREIQAFLDVGEAAGLFEEDEGELLESLVEFFDTTVREVMTPRTDMVAVEEMTPFDELLALFAESHRSRIPVYRDTIDNVKGVVHVKSMVGHIRAGTRPSAGELAWDCLVVPESKELGDLLREFQSKHQQMAIIIDEYGGTAGLVTLEDVLEEIVGEIRDEHEAGEPPEWRAIGDGRYRLQGKAPLETLEELFGVTVDDDEVDTVGGLVFSRYGTVPEPGAVVTEETLGLRFVVEAVEGRRITSLVVERQGGDEEKADG